MTSRYFSVLLAFVFLILISAIASAGQKILVTSDGESGFNPAIYNDKVVWTSAGHGGIINMRDLSTGEEMQITNDSRSLPTIHGDRIIWGGSSCGYENTYIYNTSTNITTQVTIPNLKIEG